MQDSPGESIVFTRLTPSPPVRVRPPNPARRIAYQPKWQREIIFAQDFPAGRRGDTERLIGRHIPAVVTEAADQAIAALFQIAMGLQVVDVILDQDQQRLPAIE